ncbi:MAG: GAF and ANTAR domain-containing protein [Kibdelosporangium sp.]
MASHQHDEPGLDVAPEQVIDQLDDVTSALSALSDVLDEEEELAVALHRVCQQAVHAIGEASLASVTLLGDGRPYVAAITDNQVGEVDLVQYQAGEGPCLEAAKTRQVVRVTVSEAGDRWPMFAASSAEAGIGSYLCAPLFIDSEHHGSLNLYHFEAHGFTALETALLELYTTAAEAALRATNRYLRARGHATHLKTALTSRAEIDQAKGILMAAHRVPADEAFAILVRQSQQRNVKVREVATQFITDVIATRE